jgi:predicted dehydrogenase
VALAVGLIGCGAISEFHLQAFRDHRGARVVACADVRPQAAEGRAREFDISRVFDDSTSLLDLQDLDLIDICVPPRRHLPLFLEAMHRGRHVLVEKPLGMNLAEADRMLDAAEASDRITAVPLVHRYTPAYFAARDLVGGGAIGRVRSARVSTGRAMYGDSRFTHPHSDPRGWLTDRQTAGGGMLMSSSIHFLSVLSFALGDPRAERVTARVRAAHPRAFPGIEDEADVRVDLEDGAELILSESWVVDAPYRVQISGERGELFLQGDPWSELSLEGRCEGPVSDSYQRCRRGTDLAATHEELAGLCRPLFHGLVADLVESIRRGTPVPTLPDVRHARNMQAIIAGAYQSQVEGGAVAVAWRG